MNFLIPDKMTDNEIIKALECCAITAKCKKECIFYKHSEQYDVQNCTTHLAQATLYLINRQKAEIEKWQGGYMTQKQEIANLEIELKAMRGAANSYKSEIERLQNVNDSFTDIGKLYSEIKAEASKEFAERLYKEAEKVCIDREGDFVEADNEIYDTVADWCKEISDNLLKEKVGDG